MKEEDADADVGHEDVVVAEEGKSSLLLDIKTTFLLSILFIATITPDGVLHNNLQVREEAGVILGIVFDQMKLKYADSILFHSASWANTTTQGSSTWGAPTNR